MPFTCAAGQDSRCSSAGSGASSALEPQLGSGEVGQKALSPWLIHVAQISRISSVHYKFCHLSGARSNTCGPLAQARIQLGGQLIILNEDKRRTQQVQLVQILQRALQFPWSLARFTTKTESTGRASLNIQRPSFQDDRPLGVATKNDCRTARQRSRTSSECFWICILRVSHKQLISPLPAEKLDLLESICQTVRWSFSSVTLNPPESPQSPDQPDNVTWRSLHAREHGHPSESASAGRAIHLKPQREPE